MENNEMNKTVEVKKESKIKKFFTSEKFGKVVQIGTTILTIANTVFLVWTCASSVEAEVNADVMKEYNEVKGLEVEPEPQKEIVE